MSWDKVAEMVGSALPLLGGALGGPVGAAAGRLVASALGVDAEPSEVAQAIEADPEALVKLRGIEREHERELRRMVIEAETARLAEINRTMRVEATSEDAFVRRWRPTFGYVVALTWALQAAALAWAIVAQAQYAAELINAVTALTPMWGIALAVLGINVVKRSQDKQMLAGQRPTGAVSTILGRLSGVS